MLKNRATQWLFVSCILSFGCGTDSESPAMMAIPLDLDCRHPELGCADNQVCTENGVGQFECVESPFVEMDIRVINPATGGGFQGVTVRSGESEAVTNAQGLASIAVTRGIYSIELNHPSSRPHRVFGHCDRSFEQVTYMSPNNITQFVFRSQNIEDDPEKGILVVGLDRPSLAPAVGASATIDQNSDAPFVFVGSQVVDGNEILMGAQGFVTFPNVDVGPIAVHPEFSNGTCQVFPSEMGEAEVSVSAGEVSIIAFTCR